MNCLLIFKKQSTCINITRCLTTYKGTGIQRYDEFLKKKELDKANKEENPLDFTIFGNKRKAKGDVFFYSDRKSGKGYSNYSNIIQIDRPYIWPPLKKIFKLNFYIVLVGMILSVINYSFV